jgi:hypothetical protein
MKPQGSNLNKLGSKYSLGSIIYDEELFKTGATDLLSVNLMIADLQKPQKMSDQQINRLTDSRSVNKPADITICNR